MASSNPNPLYPLPRSSVVPGCRIERCSGECGGIPISTRLHTKEITHETRPYPLTLNESGQELNVAQLSNLRDAMNVIQGVAKGLGASFMHIGKTHGDINPNTMFMNERGEGELVDWDHNYQLANLIRTFTRDRYYGQRRGPDHYMHFGSYFK